MSQLSTVDGQGSFFEQALRKDHLEDFRGLSLHRHPQLWQSLPAKQQFEFECRPDILALDEEIESLNREIQTCSIAKDMQSQRARRRGLYERRRQLTVDELKQCRKIQPRKLTSQNAHETCLEDHRRTFFAHVRGLLPERDRLASSLFQSVALRSAEGRSALHDLVALCKQDCQTIYRPSLRPKEGRCPIPDCSVEMKRSVALSILSPYGRHSADVPSFPHTVSQRPQPGYTCIGAISGTSWANMASLNCACNAICGLPALPSGSIKTCPCLKSVKILSIAPLESAGSSKNLEKLVCIRLN